MPSTTENDVIALERQYWDTMITKDVDTALRLSDDPVIVTGAQGVSTVTKDEYRKMMTEATWELHDYTFDNIQARMVNDDVAIVAYKVKENLTVDGKPLQLEASDSSTWVRRNGKWLCVMHTEAVAGDPFGRDRKPAKRAD